MNNTFHPTNIGYLPTGSATGVATSAIYLGRNVDVNWEAIGFGANGRPDYLQSVNINLTKVVGQTFTRLGTISFNVSDVQTIITADSNATAPALTLRIREVDVCDGGVAKKMMVLASDTYV